jgi:ribonucleoside-triphosphate reductase
MDRTRRLLSDLIVYTKYARWLPEKGRRETWNEIVDRNKAMHQKRFPQLANEIDSVYQYVYERKVFPSMRSLQFAGKAIELSPVRIYNCSFLPVDHPDAFSEIFFLLLSGVGVGYSVQRHHVNKLPEIRRYTKTRRFLIADSIEGWADSVKVLLKAFFEGAPLPNFDYRDIRPAGARLVTSGGIAPGPEPLQRCLFNIERMLDRKKNGDQLSPIEVHDIVCYLAEAVLSGGIRRSALISLFSLDDRDMLNAKVGYEWQEQHWQRSFANNSAVMVRHRARKPVWDALWARVKAGKTGEPGVFFTNDKEWGVNPCAEVSLRPHQFCNLVTISLLDVEDQQELESRCRAAAFIATLQAAYTDFHYLRDIWRTTTESEALIGVSLSGLARRDLDRLDLKRAASVVKQENRRVAKLIGINPAARATTVKPDGTVSLVAGTSSGVHPWHARYYLRRIRVRKLEPVYRFFLDHVPSLVEDDFFRPDDQAIISIPIAAPEDAITREEEGAIQLLDRVTTVFRTWIKGGHRSGVNHNNVSVTVSVRENEWDEVGRWLWNHRRMFTAVSVLPYDGGSYVQAPLEEITEGEFERLALLVPNELDFALLHEYEDHALATQDAACAGGACDIL